MYCTSKQKQDNISQALVHSTRIALGRMGILTVHENVHAGKLLILPSMSCRTSVTPGGLGLLSDTTPPLSVCCISMASRNLDAIMTI